MLEDLLRACVLDLKDNSDGHLPLVEFSISMVPFEGLYGRRCQSSILWDGVGERKILGAEHV